MLKFLYDYDELELYIDSNIFFIYYGKYYVIYVNNLNVILENYIELYNKFLEELLCNLDILLKEIVIVVWNNGGGYYCYSFFWEVMSLWGGGEFNGDVVKVIDYYFNIFDNLKD